MCGIAGFFDPTHSTPPETSLEKVEQMAGALHHHGPDDRGEWADAQSGIAFGFRRLAIL